MLRRRAPPPTNMARRESDIRSFALSCATFWADPSRSFEYDLVVASRKAWAAGCVSCWPACLRCSSLVRCRVGPGGAKGIWPRLKPIGILSGCGDLALWIVVHLGRAPRALERDAMSRGSRLRVAVRNYRCTDDRLCSVGAASRGPSVFLVALGMRPSSRSTALRCGSAAGRPSGGDRPVSLWMLRDHLQAVPSFSLPAGRGASRRRLALAMLHACKRGALHRACSLISPAESDTGRFRLRCLSAVCCLCLASAIRGPGVLAVMFCAQTGAASRTCTGRRGSACAGAAATLA